MAADKKDIGKLDSALPTKAREHPRLSIACSNLECPDSATLGPAAFDNSKASMSDSDCSKGKGSGTGALKAVPFPFLKICSQRQVRASVAGRQGASSPEQSIASSAMARMSSASGLYLEVGP